MGASNSRSHTETVNPASVAFPGVTAGSKREAIELLRLIEKSATIDAIHAMDGAVYTMKSVLDALPHDHPYRALYPHLAGNALLRRFL